MKPPTRLGPIEILRQIGAGGMGAVYEGVLDGARVAVKVIKPEYAADTEYRARFKREIQLVRRVSGTCTARIVAADADADPPYLATEYLDGPNLMDHVRRNGPMDETVVRALAVGLAEALVAIHSVGVVHRDLKPSNVLLTPLRPKVVDFGIAAAADVTVLTRFGEAIGSPAFMSPEQVRGDTATGATDVFAWAATVAFAATGRSPFGNGGAQTVMSRVLNDPADLDGVPTTLLPSLTAALAKDPQQRPDIRHLLRALLDETDRTQLTADEDLEPAVTRMLATNWTPAPTRGASRPWLPALAPTEAGATPLRAPAPGGTIPQQTAPPTIIEMAATPPAPSGGGRQRPPGLRVAGPVTAIAISVVIAVALVATTLHLTRPTTTTAAHDAGEPAATTPASPASDTAAPAAAVRSPAATVSPDQLAPGVQMFLYAMDTGAKRWMWRIQDLQYGTTSGAVYQAPLLGAWWALADWCHDHGRGLVGECYDYAANYVYFWFTYDPRQINSRTWTGGAIGSNIFDGHDATEPFLGITTPSTEALMDNRPGVDMLCTPNCAAVLDRS
ncbi:serine/threonine-protein kinase [Frankia sp. QA3]|uniref:serine/threonine-protein kinase n=1 Tax=Frankia sp. QA3 TaxID=710111 RepID=UPI000269C08E|nr:serine/threonine-protein kinase [Frankia sp. QA3]EIV92748.1 serine/threonine protein kinase [Frankia sp. QA3]